jgi:hypothetical protein
LTADHSQYTEAPWPDAQFKEAEARALRVQLQSLLKRDACLDDLAENRVGLLLLERAERKLFRRGQARFNFQKFAIRGLSCRAGIR